MKAKTFVNVVANVVIVAMVATVGIITLSSTTVGAFVNKENTPVYRGNSTDGVSLMINVYWGTEYIDGMLEILERYDCKATFFIGGCWAVKYPEVLGKIVEKEHELGNHGYFHKQHSKLTTEQNTTEITSCEKVVWQLTGVRTELFAPPSGDFDKKTLAACEALGYRTIMWSRDTIDWRDKSADIVYERATKNTKPGELILMHPTQHTLQALEKIVQYYKENNIKLITVGENIKGI